MAIPSLVVSQNEVQEMRRGDVFKYADYGKSSEPMLELLINA